jgi:hypothetical protein
MDGLLVEIAFETTIRGEPITRRIFTAGDQVTPTAETWPLAGPSSRRPDTIPRGLNRRAAERPGTPQERRTEMPAFGSPFSGLAHARKLSDEELVRAIRFMVAAEYEAIQLYMQLAESTDKTLAVNVLKDIADEERVHAGEFLRLLRELAPDEDKLYAQGAKEVEGAIEG